MNKLGKKLKQGIALLLAALMVVTCVPVDSLVVQAAEVQEDTDGKEQEPAAAVTGEEEDAGDAEDTEDAATPEGEETAPEDPEETPADPVKGDATVEEGEGTPDAQTTAPQVEEEIVDGTEANVPSQAAAADGATLTFDAKETGITLSLDSLDDGATANLEVDGDNYKIQQGFESISFNLDRTNAKKVKSVEVTCVSNGTNLKVTPPAEGKATYTVSLTDDADGNKITSDITAATLTITPTLYTVSTVDSDGADLSDGIVAFEGDNATNGSYSGTGDIVFTVNPGTGKKVTSVDWKTSKDATEIKNLSETGGKYTIEYSNALENLGADDDIYIVVTLANDGGSVGDSVAVELDTSALTDAGNLKITPDSGFNADGTALGENAKEIQFKLTGAETALQNFKAVKVSGVWNVNDSTPIEAVYPVNGTYTLSWDETPTGATKLTLKVVPEKYEVSVDNKNVTATFEVGTSGVTVEGNKNLYDGGENNIEFTLGLNADVTDKNIGTVTWRKTSETADEARTITPMDGTYTITSDQVAKAGLTENDDIVISVTLVNIVSVEVKEGTEAEISIEGIESSGLSQKDNTSPYTINSGVPTISFKLDGNAVTGMKAVTVTATWKDDKDVIENADKPIVDEKDGVYTITLGEQPETATTLELSVTTTPYDIIEQKDNDVTITYTNGVTTTTDPKTYKGGNSDITFKVEVGGALEGKKRVKAVYLKKDISDKEGVSVDLDNDETTYTIAAATLNALTSEDDIVISVELEDIVTVTFVANKTGTFTPKDGLEKTDASYTITKGAETFSVSFSDTESASANAPQLNVFASYDGGKIFAEYNNNNNDPVYVITVADIPEGVTELTIDYDYSKRKVSLDSKIADDVTITYLTGTDSAQSDGTAYYDGTNDITFKVEAKDSVNKRITKVTWKKYADDNSPADLEAPKDIYTINSSDITSEKLGTNDSIIICVELEDIVKVEFDLGDIEYIVEQTGSGLENPVNDVYDVTQGAEKIIFKVDPKYLNNTKSHTIYAYDGKEESDIVEAVPNNGTYTISLKDAALTGKTKLFIKIEIKRYEISLDETIAKLVDLTAEDGIITETEDGITTYYYEGGTKDLTFGLPVKKGKPYAIKDVTWKKTADAEEETKVTLDETNKIYKIPASSISLSTGDSIIISATPVRDPIQVNFEDGNGEVTFKAGGSVTESEDGTFSYNVNGEGDAKNIVLETAKANEIRWIEWSYTADGELSNGEFTANIPATGTATYTLTYDELLDGNDNLDQVDSISIKVVWKEYSSLTIAKNEQVSTVTVSQYEQNIVAEENGTYRFVQGEPISLTITTTSEDYVVNDVKAGNRKAKLENGTYTLTLTADATVTIETGVNPANAYGISFAGEHYKVKVKTTGDSPEELGEFEGSDEDTGVQDTCYSLTSELTLVFTADAGYKVIDVTTDAQNVDVQQATSGEGEATKSIADTWTVKCEAGAKGNIAVLNVEVQAERSVIFELDKNAAYVSEPVVPTQDGVTKVEGANGVAYVIDGNQDLIFNVDAADKYTTPTATITTEDGSSMDAEIQIRPTKTPTEDATSWTYEFTLSGTKHLQKNKQYTITIGEEFDRTNVTLKIDPNVMVVKSVTANGKPETPYQSATRNYSTKTGTDIVVVVDAKDNHVLTGAQLRTAEGSTDDKDKENVLTSEASSVTLTFANVGGDGSKTYGEVTGKATLALEPLKNEDESPVTEKSGANYVVDYGKTYYAQVKEGSIYKSTDSYNAEWADKDSVKSTPTKDGNKVLLKIDPEDAGKTLTLNLTTEVDTPVTDESGNTTTKKETVTIGTYVLQVRPKLTTLELTGVKFNKTTGVYEITQVIDSEKEYLLKLNNSDEKAYGRDVVLQADVLNADGTENKLVAETSVENGILTIRTLPSKEVATVTIALYNSKDTGTDGKKNYLATATLTTTKPFDETAKITAKSLSADDKTLSLTVTAPKTIVEPTKGRLYYQVKLTSDGGDEALKTGLSLGKAYQYFPKEEGTTQILNVNAIESTDPSTIVDGQAWRFSAEVTLVQTSDRVESLESDQISDKINHSSLTVPLTGLATRNPYYANKLNLKKKTTTIYTGQTVLVGSISYDGLTSYTNAKARIVEWTRNENQVGTEQSRYSYEITPDGSIYVTIKSGISSSSLGKRTLRVYLDQPSDTSYVPYKDLTINVVRGIEGLRISGLTTTIYKKAGKKATVKPTVSYNPSSTAPKTKKVTWSVGKIDNGDFRPLAPADALYNMVTINKSNGTITVNAKYVLSGNDADNTFAVKVEAADFSGNTTNFVVPSLEITDVAQSFGDIVIYKENDETGENEVIASGSNAVISSTITADKLDGATVRVLSANESLTEEIDNSNFVDTDRYTITSSNKAVSVYNDYPYVWVNKIASNVKLTVTAKDGSGVKKTLTLKKVDYAELGQLGLEIEVLGQGGNPEIIAAGESFSFNGTPATKIAVSVVEKQGNQWEYMYEHPDRAALTKWNISLSGLKDVTNYAKGMTATGKKACTKILVLSKAKGTIKLTGAGKNDKWSCDIVNSAFAGATVKAPAVKNNGVNLTNNNYYNKSPLEFTFTGKANAISAVTDTCKYVLVEPDAVKYNAKTSSFYNALYGYDFDDDANYSHIYVPLRSDGFTVKPSNSWASVPAGSYKLQLTYGNINEDNEFQAVTKTAAVTVKVTAAKNSFKLTKTYTMSAQDNAVISLTGSGKTVDHVEVTALKGTVYDGKANKFQDYLYMTDDGNIAIQLPKDGKLEDLATLAKTDREGYVKYTVYYQDETYLDSEDVKGTYEGWDKITVNFKADLTSVNKYQAVVSNDLLEGDKDVTTQVTIQSAKKAVALKYVDPNAGDFKAELNEDGKIVLKPNQALSAGKKTVSIKFMPANSYYAQTDADAIKNIATYGITVNATVTVKPAKTTKNKVAIATKDLTQTLRPDESGNNYVATVPYTLKVGATIKNYQDLTVSTGPAKSLTPIKAIKITADEVNKVLKISVSKSDMEKGTDGVGYGKDFLDTTKKPKRTDAISATLEFNSADSVAETFRLNLIMPEAPSEFDKVVTAISQAKQNGVFNEVVAAVDGYEYGVTKVEEAVNNVLAGMISKDTGIGYKVEAGCDYVSDAGSYDAKVTISLFKPGSSTVEADKVFIIIVPGPETELNQLASEISSYIRTDEELKTKYSTGTASAEELLADIRAKFGITTDKTEVRLFKTGVSTWPATPGVDGQWNVTMKLQNSKTKKATTVRANFDIPKLATENGASGKIKSALDSYFGDDAGRFTSKTLKDDVLKVASEAIASNSSLSVAYKTTSKGEDEFYLRAANESRTGLLSVTFKVTGEKTQYVEYTKDDIPQLKTTENLSEKIAKAVSVTSDELDFLADLVYSGKSEEELKADIQAAILKQANDPDIIANNTEYKVVFAKDKDGKEAFSFTAPTIKENGRLSYTLSLVKAKDESDAGVDPIKVGPVTIDSSISLLTLDAVKTMITGTEEEQGLWNGIAFAEVSKDDIVDTIKSKIREKDGYSEFDDSFAIEILQSPDPDRDGESNSEYAKTEAGWKTDGTLTVTLKITKHPYSDDESKKESTTLTLTKTEKAIYTQLTETIKAAVEATPAKDATVDSIKGVITAAMRKVNAPGATISVDYSTEEGKELAVTDGKVTGDLVFTYAVDGQPAEQAQKETYSANWTLKAADTEEDT